MIVRRAEKRAAIGWCLRIGIPIPFGWSYWPDRWAQNGLKQRIRFRLKTEDYTCRLPRPAKPRVRYKLTVKYLAMGYGPYIKVWA